MREELRHARVLGEIVVGAHAQPRDEVEIAVSCCEEDDRQRGRQRAQLAAQREATVGLVGEADVEEREIRQARAKAGSGRFAVGVGAHLVAVLLKDVGVVRADCRVVLDDRHGACHGANYTSNAARERRRNPRCPRFATIDRRFAPMSAARAPQPPL